ncbi:NAD-dependent epimerase/dehydratase family protein [Tardiphaga sp. 803_E3_N1_3]|uniref:NAD-dependent epimerase/dehydratase family protein n=1 Tax=unclassified Tardiphaga TaxID=2631404 RepID=UPI003F203FC9
MTNSNQVALVTGARGSIGRHVAQALSSFGWQVHGLGHGEWAEGAATAGLRRWHAGTVDLPALRALALKPDLIVHCAGSGSVGASLVDPLADFQRTVGSTAVLLEYMRADCPAAALVYPSSAAVYGHAERLPTKEDGPLCPVSPYGFHKKIAEELIRAHGVMFGLRVSIVRLFSIYGEGFRKQLLWDACGKILAGEREFFGTGDETRDWLHVDDAAALLIRAGEVASPECPTMNGGTGEAVTVAAILNELAILLGVDEKPRFVGATRAGDPRDYQADMTRALQSGWAPSTSWREGLRRYVAWYLEERAR